jgi:hypothetical protein
VLHIPIHLGGTHNLLAGIFEIRGECAGRRTVGPVVHEMPHTFTARRTSLADMRGIQVRSQGRAYGEGGHRKRK